MTTIVDMSREFEEKLQEELFYWNRQDEGLLAQLDELNENYATLNWRQLEDLEELLNVDGPRIQSKIDEITATLEAIKEEKKKKFETIKFEIQEKSLQMMYNPIRVARLLADGLISFYDDSLQEM